MKRSALFSKLVALSLLGGSSGLAWESLPPIVFASRQLGDAPKPENRQSAIERSTRGRLLVLESGGALRTLVDGTLGTDPEVPVDVMDPDVSYDGGRILFAGYLKSESAWRIFEIETNGSGLRQITRSDRKIDLSRYGALAAKFESYDDVDPCYLPGGKICFVSTRTPGVAPDGRVRATNLYVANGDGDGVHRITSERFGADSPAVEPSSGKIVYSRWWRTAQAKADAAGQTEPIPPGSPGYGDGVIDSSDVVLRGLAADSFPGLNSWFLSSINPDGTDLAMYSGFRIDRTLTQAHRPAFLGEGRAIALFIPHTPFYGYPRGNGLRLLTSGPSAPRPLGGPQAFDPVPKDATVPPPLPATPFLYSSAAPLPDGRMLVTAADFTTLDYGIYIQGGTEFPAVLKNLSGTAEMDALPIVGRPEPLPILDRVAKAMSDDVPQTVEEAFDQGGSFTFLCENIHGNAPVDVAIATAPPIGKKLRIEFYMNPQRQSPTAGDPPLLIGSQDVPPDGRIEMQLPAGVPLFEVLRRPDGKIAVGRDGQIFHVGGMNFGRAGETNRCVGCHAGHSQMKVPDDPAWTNVAPSAMVIAPVALPGPKREPQSFLASNLVDRQTGDPRTEWSSFDAPGAEVTFNWTTRLRAREVIVHGTMPGNDRFGIRDQVIHRLSIDLRLDGLWVEHIDHNQDIRPEGSVITVNQSIEFNSLRIVIEPDAFTGIYEGMKGPALAEVEVIGQATGTPSMLFMRGDAGCDRVIDLTDVIVILIHSFLNPAPLCCDAAADANADGAIDITDPIMLLNFMFLSGPAPSAPFPACGTDSRETASCDVGMCF